MNRWTVSLLLLTFTLLSACTPSVRGSVNEPRMAMVRRVAVLPFTTPDGTPRALSESFADEISSDLAGAPFTVVDRPSAMGVDAVLLGRVITYRDQALSPGMDTSLAISVRLVDVHTREVLLSTSSEATAAATFCGDEMTCLRGKVMASLGRFIVKNAAPERVADGVPNGLQTPGA
jgi:hypothetical protein